MPRSSAATAAMICAGFLVIFYLVGLSAARRHSPSIDEPLHAVAAYVHVFERDYRLDAEDPPLWNYLAMLPHHRGALTDPSSRTELWDRLLDQPLYGFMLTSQWLFQTPANDGVGLINASRVFMLVLGVALGAAIAYWAWRLDGVPAAIFACALFSFDPNFLAHAPLVKNDIVISLLIFCAALGAWTLGRSARWWNLTMTALVCAAAPAVKFSGVIVLPLLLMLLLCRAILPMPWLFLGTTLNRWPRRAVAAAAVWLACAALTVLVIWASYGFRYDPTPVPGQRLASDARVEGIKSNRFYLDNNRYPEPAELAAFPTPLTARVVLFADSHRLLPHAWLFGFLFTYGASLVRESYLLGEHGLTGWWYYFPLALLFKTPLATLAAAAAAGVTLIRRRARFSVDASDVKMWAIICLSLPVLAYGGTSLRTHLNLGVRHVLPLYPFLFVTIGVVMARVCASSRRWGAIVALVLFMALAGETLLRYPHYISFFNAAARPYRMKLLSDSNWDWGQDLNYVAEWQRKNPSVPLYLGYWGAVDPAFYGIRYTNVPGGFILNREMEWPPSRPGILALSAGLVQGVNCPPDFRSIYPLFQGIPPREILGDTIFLYDWPPRPTP